MSFSGFFPFVLIVLLFSACAPKPGPVAEQPPERPQTGVYGRVLGTAGQPSSGAWVFAYRGQSGLLRGPADFAARALEGGVYSLDLLPGRWYLVARNRQQGSISGPPKAGDAWSVHPANPVIVAAGQGQRIDFRLHEVAQPMLLRGGSLAQGDTGFRGRLVDARGRPLPGAIALAYRDTDFRRMPDHTSAAVGADGVFTLYVPKPGRYCLAARQGTRGQPIQGEPYGVLGEGEQACREVEQGAITDVGSIRLTPYLR